MSDNKTIVANLLLTGKAVRPPVQRVPTYMPPKPREDVKEKSVDIAAETIKISSKQVEVERTLSSAPYAMVRFVLLIQFPVVSWRTRGGGGGGGGAPFIFGEFMGDTIFFGNLKVNYMSNTIQQKNYQL